jgi:hypothetical protein
MTGFVQKGGDAAQKVLQENRTKHKPLTERPGFLCRLPHDGAIESNHRGFGVVTGFAVITLWSP